MKVTFVAANPFNTICANIHAIWECFSSGYKGVEGGGEGTLENAAPFFHFDFASFRSLANFRTRTQNQHNFIYLKQYRLAKGSTWRRRREQPRQKVWLLNYFNLVGFRGDDNSYKMRAEKKDAAQLGKKSKRSSAWSSQAWNLFWAGTVVRPKGMAFTAQAKRVWGAKSVTVAWL